MTKEEWQALYNILDNTYSDFIYEYSNMKNGRNQKIRTEAGRKVDSSIRLATVWIRKYPEAFKLLTGENATPFEQAIVWDEFVKPNWFKGDMSDYLQKIKDKIQSL